MDKNLKNCSSYSDLFEDFFRTDAGQEVTVSTDCSDINNMFTVYPCDQQQQMVQVSDLAQLPSDQAALDFYLQQQAAFYQAASYAYAPAAVQKPGFIRNRTRKNMRQKSVASAVRASHMINAKQGHQIVNAPANSQTNIPVNVNDYQAMYQQQQQAQAQVQFQNQIPPQQFYGQQIPYYQSASQIPTYQQQQHPQQQTAVLMAKSPASQSPIAFMRTSLPTSPSARSPNTTSSDYVKMKLQQKIRSRMVSKGQIPPNPTEEELRMCGMQMSQQQIVTPSQLPTPKSSPHQIPRAFNNNSAAFIAAPMVISNQIQQDDMVQDDLLKYFDLNAEAYCQKDPLSIHNPITNDPTAFLKQQQQQQKQQIQADLLQQDGSNAVNYDQFFSDFILY